MSRSKAVVVEPRGPRDWRVVVACVAAVLACVRLRLDGAAGGDAARQVAAAAAAGVVVYWAICGVGVAWTRACRRVDMWDAIRGRRNTRSLRLRWGYACERANLDGRRGVPRLTQVRIGPGGDLTARVDAGRVGFEVGDVQRAAARLAAVLGAKAVTVADDEAGWAALAIRYGPPRPPALTTGDLPVAPPGRIVIGRVLDTGEPATLEFGRSILIGGMTGSGKSGVWWAICRHIVAEGIPTRLRAIDPKGGVELRVLDTRVGLNAGPFKVHEYAMRVGPARTRKDAAADAVEGEPDRLATSGDVIMHMHRAMEARMAAVRAKGLRQHVATPDEPADILVIDELLAVLGNTGKDEERMLREIAYMGRAALFFVVALTQRGQVDVLGQFRGFMPQRVALATNDKHMTNAILNDTATEQGALAHHIPKSTPGVGYIADEESRDYVKIRAVYMNDDEVAMLARGVLPKAKAPQSGRARRRGEPDPGRTALYRWYPLADLVELLRDEPPDLDAVEVVALARARGLRPGYVGISYDALQREAQHSDGLREFMDGNPTRVTVFYDTRVEAKAAETEAIHAERPVFNVAENGAAAPRAGALRVYRGGGL